jgi:CheY-like chemotaxis protein
LGAHVLIVEDSALVVGALRLLLEETGYRVSSAANVRDAVDVMRHEHPDVMLLDLTLRGENGLTVLDELRRTRDEPRVTVAVTGHDAPEVRERCLRAGCREVLVKPINTRELPRKIALWLEGEASGPGE